MCVSVVRVFIQCLTAPPRKDGLYAIGALNLLSDPSGTLPLALDTTETTTGQGTETTALRDAFQHGEFDIVIQNPPYTRSGADGNSNVPKSIFADKKEAAAMRASQKAQKCQLSGNNTGLGAHFVDLADRMLKQNGKMAFVLPVTAITGDSWYKVPKFCGQKDITMSSLSLSHMKLLKNAPFRRIPGWQSALLLRKKGNAKTQGEVRLSASSDVRMENWRP